MNQFVSDPHWGWWIILYFYLGGIAAGAYFLATLIDLVGRREDQRLCRSGYLIALPLIVLCAVFLIVDLNQPGRFWHMLLKSEVVHAALEQRWPFSVAGWKTMNQAPLIKYWSPMSIGSWALSLFGLCSLLSFLAAVWPRSFIGRWHSARWFGHPVRLVGCAVGFFVAAYTGTLLTATNQPIWSDSIWIASLFLTSAASTGLAAMTLVTPKQLLEVTRVRLRRADLWFLCLELAILLIFLASLGPLLLPLLGVLSGKVFVAGTLFVGLLVPLLLHMLTHAGAGRPSRHATVTIAVLVLIGGFSLRWGILRTPSALLSSESHRAVPATGIPDFGPEGARLRGGGRGADPGNRPPVLQPRSKVFLP